MSDDGESELAEVGGGNFSGGGPGYGTHSRSRKTAVKQAGRICLLVALTLVCLAVFSGVIMLSFDSGHSLPWNVDRHSLPPSVASNIDFSAPPCKDFYQFACGGFESRISVPKDREEWALSWDGAESFVREELHRLVVNDTGKAGRFFKSCMNIDDISALGGLPLSPFLLELDKIKRFGELIDSIVLLQQVNVAVLFDWEVVPDGGGESNSYVLALIPGGLSLPRPELYSGEGADSKRVLHMFERVVRNALMLAGKPDHDADEDARSVVQTEMVIASMIGALGGGQDKKNKKTEKTAGAKTKVGAGDVNGNGQEEEDGLVHMTLEDLNKLAPHFEFPKIFDEMVSTGTPLPGTQGRRNIVVHDRAYFKQLSKWLSQLEPRSLLPYLKFRLIYSLASLLSPEFSAGNMDLVKALTGIQENAPRWRTCLDETTRNLPDDVGMLFAAHAEREGARDAAVTLLEDIRQGFRDVLAGSSSWYSPTTRRVAVAKLENMIFEIGHPQQWHPSPFAVHTDSFAANTLRARRHLITEALARLANNAVDRTRWGHISVTDATTFYSRSLNTLFVPAAMLQPPFFSPHYVPARNFGSLGAVVAHEISHGLDRLGADIGPEMEKGNWWSVGDKERFSARAACVRELYDSFDTSVGKVNGTKTEEENIGDIAGVEVSYRSLEKHLGRGIAPLPLKVSQLFFISWGQTWCSVTRQRLARLKLQHDIHAPDKWRCNGPCSQMHEFARSFGCAGGTTMNPYSRCHLLG